MKFLARGSACLWARLISGGADGGGSGDPAEKIIRSLNAEPTESGSRRPDGDCVRPTPQNDAKIARALEEFGFADLDRRDLSQPGKVIMLGRPPMGIDLLSAFLE